MPADKKLKTEDDWKLKLSNEKLYDDVPPEAIKETTAVEFP